MSVEVIKDQAAAWQEALRRFMAVEISEEEWRKYGWAFLDQVPPAAIIELCDGYRSWEPIETAPKDKHVLLLWDWPDDPTTGSGFWRGDKWVAAAHYLNASLPHPPLEIREHYPEPTHWMPLPEPPK